MIDIEKLHTTPMGIDRIRRNLSLDIEDVVTWCKEAVRTTDTSAIYRQGKNWYVTGDGFVLTINAHSHTIITAHKSKP
ncbi:MAG: DUF3781 domain-containing protein [Clostridium sp.]|jgi:hypothetical protein|nr:DUF3781 domain-containing protein [Clostridium sp.]